MSDTTSQRVFVFERDPATDIGPSSFLVAPDSSAVWNLPTRTTFPNVDSSFQVESGTEFSLCEVENNVETVMQGDHLWVCFEGLQSVLEYMNQDVQDALTHIDTSHAPCRELGRRALDATQWSVLIVKPDALSAGLEDDILSSVVAGGLNITAEAVAVSLTQEDVEQVWTPPTKWQVPQEPSDWWYATVDYMREAPVSAYLCQGENASAVLKDIKADLREKHGSDPHAERDIAVAERVRSLIHCSDRTEELVRNAALFWSTADIRNVVENRTS